MYFIILARGSTLFVDLPMPYRRQGVRLLCLSAVLLAGTGSRPATTSLAQGSAPTVLLVALDGFRPDYVDRAPSRHLRELMHAGVRARWMVPVFPSVTFPNFYTIATGLYPEHHGIVSNTMLDSALGSFSLRDRSSV